MLNAMNAAIRSLVAASTLAMAGAVFAADGPAAPKIDLDKGRQVASQVCAACHAVDGNATGPANPKLAAQHPEYLVKQLHDFRVAPGASEAARANAIMAGFAAQLSEEDIRNVSAFYATQPLQPSAAKARDLAELGQKIYRAGIAEKGVPACAACHSPSGAGIPALYPRLHGQWAEYTESQLIAFRGRTRKNSAQMTAIAARMSDLEIKAVSDYIAGLR